MIERNQTVAQGDLHMPLIPMVIQSDGRAERSFDIYSRLLNERVVFLGSAIDDEVANLVVAQLLHLEAEDPEKDVCLYINSPGGQVYAGLAIYDTIQHIRPDVQTVCCAIAMSMGALILTGGTPGKRRGAFARAEPRGTAPAAVRAATPRAGGPLLETNTQDLPFLVDSGQAQLTARGLHVVRDTHPTIGVERDAAGASSASAIGG